MIKVEQFMNIKELSQHGHSIRAIARITGHARNTVRFETPRDEQAQADWGYCGRFPTNDGKAISVYVFVMVLSFSRMMFLDFANHYGFVPRTHRPYRPRTKGKVERVVDYAKDNFLAGRDFSGLDDLNAQGLHWLEHTANVRIHGTTKRRPIDLFSQEQAKLVACDSVPAYRFLDPVPRVVNWESMIHFQGSRYSVPPQYAGQTVTIFLGVDAQRQYQDDQVLWIAPRILK